MYRSVIYEDHFDAQLDEIRALHSIGPDRPDRLDDVVAGVEWGIAENATAPEFPEIPGTILRLAKTDPSPGLPALRMYFTVDNGTCTMRHVEEIEVFAEEEDESF